MSVSVLLHPELKGLPVAVCYGSDKIDTSSEIASCNYEARKFGVRNGMMLSQGRELCPTLSVAP